MPDTTRAANRLLASLSIAEYGALLPKLERVPLVYDTNIYSPGDLIEHVYFPESGILSLLSTVDTDSSLEVGIVGNEGLAGLSVFLGVETSVNRAVVQGAGFAQKIGAADFLAACHDGIELPRLILRYIHSLLTQISQSAACNRFHPIDARLARWLMMTRDRMHDNEFQITQSFLSSMLGVRREGVSKAAGELQERGLISYSRGNLAINDLIGLTNAACQCYAIIKKEYENMPADVEKTL